MLDNLIKILNSKYMIKILLLLIILDTILGSIRALKEHKWNSTFGINGILRKTAMIICTISFVFIDYILRGLRKKFYFWLIELLWLSKLLMPLRHLKNQWFV